jgi:hypothetical protein
MSKCHCACACAGNCKDVSLTCSFWQLADLHRKFMRMPTLLKVWQLTPAVVRLCCCCSSQALQKVHSDLARTAAVTICTLATMQARGRSVSAEDFRAALLSGDYFGKLITCADAVAECAVPPGAASVVATTLKGFTEMGRLAQSGAPNWCVQAGLFIPLHVARHWQYYLTLILLRLMPSVSAVQATGLHGRKACGHANRSSGMRNGSGD